MQITIKSRMYGNRERFINEIIELLIKGEIVFVALQSYLSAVQYIEVLQTYGLSFSIKLEYNTNLSNIRFTNEDAVRKGYELHQDEQWGVYARRFTGITLTPKK